MHDRQQDCRCVRRNDLRGSCCPQKLEQWALQQLREAIPSEPCYRFLIHDRDSIFSMDLDRSIRNLGLRVLKTPYRSPRANSLCERLIGTLRREALDWVMPFGERHLRRLLNNWVAHYNSGRPHMSLGPGVPAPASGVPVAIQSARHSIPTRFEVAAHRCSPDCTTNTVCCHVQRDDDQSFCGPQPRTTNNPEPGSAFASFEQSIQVAGDCIDLQVDSIANRQIAQCGDR